MQLQRAAYAGSTASANVNVVLHPNDVVVGRTYELSLAAGSSSIGATTVTYKAQIGDDAQSVMRGLGMLCVMQTFVLTVAPQQLLTQTQWQER